MQIKDKRETIPRLVANKIKYIKHIFCFWCIYRLFNCIFLMVKFWFLWLPGKDESCAAKTGKVIKWHFILQLKEWMWLPMLTSSLPSLKCLLADFPSLVFSHLTCEMRPQHCREPRVSKICLPLIWIQSLSNTPCRLCWWEDVKNPH